MFNKQYKNQERIVRKTVIMTKGKITSFDIDKEFEE